MGFLEDQLARIKNGETVGSTKLNRVSVGGFWTNSVTKADGSPGINIKGKFGAAQLTLFPSRKKETTSTGKPAPDWFGIISEPYDREKNPEPKSFIFPQFVLWENKNPRTGKITLSGNFGNCRMEFVQTTPTGNGPDWLLYFVERPVAPRNATVVNDVVEPEFTSDEGFTELPDELKDEVTPSESTEVSENPFV